MTGEWDIERLDVDAYLERIGHARKVAPTAETLASLQRAHIASIPFENLDIVLGRGIAVDLESVQEKLVARRRGGYCYEHGVLFAAALERLGFRVERMLARIGGDDVERPRAKTHMTVRAHADGAPWLADVGFGSGLLRPLPFDREGPQTQGGWTFQLVATGPSSWAVRERLRGEWITHYGFENQRLHAADVVMANHFTSTFERSPFVGKIVAARRDEDALRRLVGRTFTLERPDGSVEERKVGDDELAGILRGVFAIPLSHREIERLTFVSTTAG